MYFVFFWIVVLVGLRAAVMDHILKPLVRMGGIESKKAGARFAEQAWVMIYATTSWILGMVKFRFKAVHTTGH